MSHCSIILISDLNPTYHDYFKNFHISDISGLLLTLDLGHTRSQKMEKSSCLNWWCQERGHSSLQSLTYLASTVNFACTIPKDKTCNYKDSYFIPVISSSWGGNTFLFLRRQYIMANNIELRIRPPGTPSNLLVMWSKTWYLSFLSLSILIYELRIIRAPISRFLRRSDGIKSWRPSQNFTQFKSLVNMFVIVAVTDIF